MKALVTDYDVNLLNQNVVPSFNVSKNYLNNREEKFKSPFVKKENQYVFTFCIIITQTTNLKWPNE